MRRRRGPRCREPRGRSRRDSRLEGASAPRRHARRRTISPLGGERQTAARITNERAPIAVSRAHETRRFRGTKTRALRQWARSRRDERRSRRRPHSERRSLLERQQYGSTGPRAARLTNPGARHRRLSRVSELSMISIAPRTSRPPSEASIAWSDEARSVLSVLGFGGPASNASRRASASRSKPVRLGRTRAMSRGWP